MHQVHSQALTNYTSSLLHTHRTKRNASSLPHPHRLVEVSDLDELIERNNPDYTLEPLTAPRPLTEKLVQGLAINNTLIVTYGNTHMTDILLNFLAHLNKLGGPARHHGHSFFPFTPACRCLCCPCLNHHCADQRIPQRALLHALLAP